MKRLLIFTTIVLIVVLASTPVMATTWSATTSNADAYIRSGNPDVAGNGFGLQAGWSSTTSIAIRRGLVRWDMTNAPGQAAVNSAANSVRVKLYCYTRSSNTAYSHELRKVTADWLETTATWNSMNANYLGVFATTSVGAVGDYTWQWNGSTGGIPVQNRGVQVYNSGETVNLMAKTFNDKENTGVPTIPTALPPRLEIDYTAPVAPGSGAADTITTDSIRWNWGAAARADGYRLYTADSGGTLLGRKDGGTNLTTGSLAANTSYTRYIASYTASILGDTTGIETAARTALTAVTLSVAPIESSVGAATSNNKDFTWTSAIAWGAGGVSKLGYVFDQNAAHTWTGFEDAWTGSTLSTTATTTGTWYLHVQGYNSASIGNGTFDYSVGATIPEPGSLLAFGTGLIGLVGFRRRRRA